MHPLTTFGAGPTMHCSVRKCAPETEASSMRAKTFGAGQRSCMGNSWTPNPNRGPRVPCGALSAPGPLPPPLQGTGSIEGQTDICGVARHPRRQGRGNPLNTNPKGAPRIQQSCCVPCRVPAILKLRPTFVMSHTTGRKSWMGTPLEMSSCCSASSLSRRRATATTLMPAVASTSHTAHPMPAEAPVTSAHLPCHLQQGSSPAPVDLLTSARWSCHPQDATQRCVGFRTLPGRRCRR